MKIGVLIPTRGDRPEFIAQCKRMIHNQTLQPDHVFFINFPPKGTDKDITYRYRVGYQKAKEMNIDFLVFWEDDDWYHPTYIEHMFNKWQANKRPLLFGLEETYYYHIGIDKCHYDNHPRRASAFSTCIGVKSGNLTWPLDNYAFTDLHLWKAHSSSAISEKNETDKPIAIGIKHGIGVTGGAGHNPRFKWNTDKGIDWLRSCIDEDSFNFYQSIKHLCKK